MGSAKAAVLPVPVCAIPTRSRPAEDQRDGVGLDRGGGGVLLFSEGASDRLSEAEIVWKGGQSDSPDCGGMRRRDSRAAGDVPAGSIETPRLIWAVNVIESCRKAGRNRCFLVVVQAAPPAARERADGRLHGSLIAGLFKAGVLRTLSSALP